ncbi:MAG: ABC transporter substrate-binding protein [Candidatus Limnocylindria bacterium]
MRIASLVPAGTEIVCALGARDQLVAVTHDCDHPEDVRALPRLTRTTVPRGASSSEIDGLVRSAGERGESTFHLDGDAMRAARPDIIVGQTICRVCAITFEQLPASLSAAPVVVPLVATSLEGVFADIRGVGAALGLDGRAERVVAGLRARIAAIGHALEGAPRPRVVCLEWTEPLFQGGHWVPEQVDAAGGTDLLGVAGERSRELAWDDVVAADPDVVVVMPCGFGAKRAIDETATLAAQPGWQDLAAVRAGRVYAVDGAAYFSRPGPRVVDGIEVLAGLFHPSRVPAPLAAAATRVA